MNTMQQRLSDGTLQSLAVLVDQLHLTNHFSGEALLQGADPIIRSPHPFKTVERRQTLAAWAAGHTIPSAPLAARSSPLPEPAATYTPQPW